MVYDVVGEDELPNAVAINSLGSNTMRIVGPAAAGALIGAVGIEAAFILQAAAYSVLRVLHVADQDERHAVVDVHDDRAARACRRHRLRALQPRRAAAGRDGGAAESLLVYPYVQYIPVFAKDVLHVGSVGFGFLASAVGYGSIVGALIAANLTQLKKRGQILVWTTFVYMALVTAFALSNNFALSFALLVVAGVANSIYLMFNQVMVQLIVDDEYRGRVLSLYVMVSGITPFSALLMGALIGVFGAQVTVAVFTGLAAAIVLVIGIFSRRLRRSVPDDRRSRLDLQRLPLPRPEPPRRQPRAHPVLRHGGRPDERHRKPSTNTMNAAIGTRMPHALKVNVASTNFTSPAPRSAPDSDAWIAIPGSANENTRSNRVPVSTTSGSSTKMPHDVRRDDELHHRHHAQGRDREEPHALGDLLRPSGSPAPRLCPTSAVAAVPSANAGRIATSSDRSAK